MNKKTWFIVAGVVVIAILAVVFYKQRQPKDDVQTTPASNTQPVVNAAPADNANQNSAPSNSAAKKLSYTDAVAKYGSNRIQFDATCQAHPNAMVVKNGTVLMLDNRSQTSQKIVFNGKTYTISALDYTTVTASSTTFPKEVLVDCGTSQNVARITIQK